MFKRKKKVVSTSNFGLRRAPHASKWGNFFFFFTDNITDDITEEITKEIPKIPNWKNQGNWEIHQKQCSTLPPVHPLLFLQRFLCHFSNPRSDPIKKIRTLLLHDFSLLSCGSIKFLVGVKKFPKNFFWDSHCSNGRHSEKSYITWIVCFHWE